MRRCRVLDMPLIDVRRLLDLLTDPAADCRTADCLIDGQLARVQKRIADLRILERQLQSRLTHCASQASSADCGILQELMASASCVRGPRGADDRG